MHAGFQLALLAPARRGAAVCGAATLGAHKRRHSPPACPFPPAPAHRRQHSRRQTFGGRPRRSWRRRKPCTCGEAEVCGVRGVRGPSGSGAAQRVDSNACTLAACARGHSLSLAANVAPSRPLFTSTEACSRVFQACSGCSRAAARLTRPARWAAAAGCCSWWAAGPPQQGAGHQGWHSPGIPRR